MFKPDWRIVALPDGWIVADMHGDLREQIEEARVKGNVWLLWEDAIQEMLLTQPM